MKNLRFNFLLTSTFAAAAVAASLLPAADDVIDGRWKWSSEIGGNPINSVLTLKSDGKKITGNYKDENINATIEGGEIDGRSVVFEISFDYEGDTIKAAFDGMIKGDKIDGDVEISVGGNAEGSYEWNPTRLVELADVVGTWKFIYTAPDGVEYQPVLKLTEKGGKLSGEIATEDESVEVQDAKLINNKLMFNYTVDYQGSDLSLEYVCLPRGDKLTGTLEYEVDGNSGEFEIEATKEPKQKGAELVGAWQVELESPEGDTYKPTLEIMSDGKKLTGKLSGDVDGTPFEKMIAEIKVDGNKIMFPVTLTNDGTDIKLTWNLSVSGNSLKGNVDYDIDGDTGTMPAKGKRGQ